MLSHMKAKKRIPQLVRFSVSGLAPELLSEIDRIAKEQGRSRNSQIRLFLANVVRQCKRA